VGGLGGEGLGEEAGPVDQTRLERLHPRGAPRRAGVARTGILLALGGLILAGLCLRTPTGLGPDVAGSGLAPVNGWSGAGLSLALGGVPSAARARGAGLAAVPAAPAGRFA